MTVFHINICINAWLSVVQYSIYMLDYVFDYISCGQEAILDVNAEVKHFIVYTNQAIIIYLFTTSYL